LEVDLTRDIRRYPDRRGKEGARKLEGGRGKGGGAREREGARGKEEGGREADFAWPVGPQKSVPYHIYYINSPRRYF